LRAVLSPRERYEPVEPVFGPVFEFDDTVAAFAGGEVEGLESPVELVDGFDDSPDEPPDDEVSDFEESDVPESDFDFAAEASARASVR
jgi:hypothetical protein